ncbi:hypothetical protein N8510_01765 [bacterium]|nr:hypothetical protein [bacterium]MDB4654240.1 hypothetical protein [Rubripirellula sp.]
MPPRSRKLDAARAYADASKVWKRSTSSFATPQYKVKNFGSNQASPKKLEMSNYFPHKVKNTPTRLTSFVSSVSHHRRIRQRADRRYVCFVRFLAQNRVLADSIETRRGISEEPDRD